MYSIKLHMCIVMWSSSASSTKASLTSVLKALNGAQFLNATCVAALSGSFVSEGLQPAAAIVLVTVIFPVSKLYASE